MSDVLILTKQIVQNMHSRACVGTFILHLFYIVMHILLYHEIIHIIEVVLLYIQGTILFYLFVFKTDGVFKFCLRTKIELTRFRSDRNQLIGYHIIYLAKSPCR